jgi:phenylacetate-coenzyme A ligase PaaK-like adenylate-forming protein
MSTAPTDYTLPDILYQPWEDVEALQDRLLKQMVEICYDHHPYYSRVMKELGLTPADIQNREDLKKLPVIGKKEFLAEPENFRLDPDGLPMQEATLWKIIYTTGTTSGRPAPIFVTAHDYFAYQDLFRTRGSLLGINDTDMIANLFPMTNFPLGAFSRAPDEAAAMGASIMFGLTGRVDSPYPVNRSVDEAVEAVARHGATVLWGVAGFVRRVLLRAIEMKADFTKVRMVVTTGEASSPAMREDLRTRMRSLGCADTLIVNRYGSTEQGGTMIECQDGSGFHSSMPDQVFHEIVDDESGERLADGEAGMLAITHLNRRGTVFLRYKIGDMGELDHSPCPHCGRTTVRLSSKPVRTGDIIKIKGALVNLGNLKSELDKVDGLEEYQIVVSSEDLADPFSPDVLKVRISAREGSVAEMPDTVSGIVTKLSNLRPKIEEAKRDEIFDPTTMAKPKRIVDERKPR